MEAPKCKICQQRHYGMCPSVRSAGAVRAKSVAVPPLKPATVSLVPILTDEDCARIAERTVRLLRDGISIDQGGNFIEPADLYVKAEDATGFDKRAYQREYMRKRRAAAKAIALEALGEKL